MGNRNESYKLDKTNRQVKCYPTHKLTFFTFDFTFIYLVAFCHLKSCVLCCTGNKFCANFVG